VSKGLPDPILHNPQMFSNVPFLKNYFLRRAEERSNAELMREYTEKMRLFNRIYDV
jgi:hypothetical protein